MPPELARAKERILVIDDDHQILALLGRILKGAGYRHVLAGDVEQARTCLADAPFDLMLCDVELGDESGIDLVEHVLALYPHTAAVMVSGLDNVALADRALAVGAYGYLVKPFTSNDVLRSVLGAISRRQHELDVEQELRASREETIERLCIAVEARDPETATHISQMSQLCRDVALELRLPREHCELIRIASAMHDVGKIGIPDNILLKPGKLTPAERTVMEEHAEIGYRILVGSRSELLQLAALIAFTHHERFDGSGYPRGIRGVAIPLEGRIAAVADVYDALTRDRVYRPRMTHDEAMTIMEEGRGTHFDPEVLDALLAVLERLPTSAPDAQQLLP
jgi:putative two-component system response regulator